MLDRTKISRLAILGLSSLLIHCDKGELIKDPIVQRWCGQRPCDWDAEGEIRRVGSWHPDDYAAELVSDDAKLSQLNSQVDQDKSSCFSFSLIADIDARAHVFLELDFLDDGVIDFSQRLPESRWDKRTFNITAPTWYKGVRFIIRKDGPGHAVVAELRAQDAGERCSAPPIPLSNRPDAARCETDAECVSTKCVANRCGECSTDSDCNSGEYCGRASEDAGLTTRCVATGARALGQDCVQNSECATRSCNNGACSECSLSAPCPNGACLVSKHAPSKNAPHWPTQCAPDRLLRAAGARCVSDDDCIGNKCSGASYVCDDAACASAEDDAGCSDCSSWSVTGGICD